MKKRIFWWLLICILFLSAACTSPANVVMTEKQALQYAETFMDLMSAEEYEQARTYFDPNLSQALTREIRSEERRVGQECGYRLWPYD